MHIVDGFEPRVGGIETQVRDLADQQARAGMDVHVLTATASARERLNTTLMRGGRRHGVEVRASGVTVHRLVTPLSLGIPINPRQRRLLRAKLDELRAEGPLVVHAHAGVVSPFAYAGLAQATAGGLPTVITWNSLPGSMKRAVRSGAEGATAPFVASAVSAVTASEVSAALGPAASSHAVGGTVRVIPNGIDITAWRTAADEARRLLELTGRPNRDHSQMLELIATQRLTPRKRTRELVATVLAVHERLGRTSSGLPRMTLTVAGDGREMGALESMIGGREDVVRLLGQVASRDLAALYARRDVFVSSAKAESFGIAALEARAAGLPILALAGSGPTEFITDGVDGRIAWPVEGRARLQWKRFGHRVDPALAEVLQAWVVGAEDWAALGRAARKTSPNAGWRRSLEECEAAYRAAREAAAER